MKKEYEMAVMALMATFGAVLFAVASPAMAERPGDISVSSPDGRVACVFSIRDGRPVADVSYGGKPAFSSVHGVDRGSLVVQKAETRTVRSAWKPVLGFRKEYPAKYTELSVRLGREGHVASDETLYIRCYDEGFAVRAKVVLENYVLDSLAEEMSDWRFVSGTVAWGITSGEATYPESPVDIVRMEAGRDYMFPLTVRMPDVGYACVFEARAERYPRSYLCAEGGVLRPRFVTGVMEGRGEVYTPWRAVQLATSSAELVERAYFAENLNESCAIADTSWIKPGFCVSDLGNFELRTEEVIASAKEAAKIGAKYVQVDWGWYGTEYVWTDDDRAAYAAKHPELKGDRTWEANTRATSMSPA